MTTVKNGSNIHISDDNLASEQAQDYLFEHGAGLEYVRINSDTKTVEIKTPLGFKCVISFEDAETKVSLC